MEKNTLLRSQAYYDGFRRRRHEALRLASAFLLLMLLLVAFPFPTAAVSFVENHECVYDIAPEIKVLGSGFQTLTDSGLEISFEGDSFYNHIIMQKMESFSDMDFDQWRGRPFFESEISNDTVITLKLIGNHTRWPVEEGLVSVADILLSISSLKADGVELLDKPLTIAKLITSPGVLPSYNMIYAESTPELEVKGFFFHDNSKGITFFFNPPLEGVGMQMQSLSKILFTKEIGHQWATEPGPLTLVGIDTGFGRLHVDPQGITHVSTPEEVGVVVAEVQAELDKSGITVNSNGMMYIYQSTKRIQVSGSGFKPGMKLRFGNYGCGGGANFDMTDLQPDKFTLELNGGSKWCKNVKARPAPLVLVAADAGQGWVPLGATVDKSGRTIANVLGDPFIQPSFTQEVSSRMFRSQTTSLTVKGAGFGFVGDPPVILEFEPPLASRPDIWVEAFNTITVHSNSLEWTEAGYIGPLSVKGMDGGAGMVVFDPPVQVATIVERIITNFTVDGLLRHQVVNETCSDICLDLSWDAVIDGNDGVCICDQRGRHSFSGFPYYDDTLFFSSEDAGTFGSIDYGSGFENNELHDTCNTCCHQLDEWDAYYYQDHIVCVCGSENELFAVGGDWFDEDGWDLLSHIRSRHGGFEKHGKDKGVPKKRIWLKIKKRRGNGMPWDSALLMSGLAWCGICVLVLIFISRRMRSRRRV